MSENKRAYVKPDFTMMYFKLSDNIAATGCTSSSTSTSTYEAQNITCVIDGSEYVFYSGNSECKSSASSGYLGYYNGDLYFVWYDGVVGAKPSSDQETLLKNIETAVGATDALGNSGWHAGKATATISTIWNSSY